MCGRDLCHNITHTGLNIATTLYQSKRENETEYEKERMRERKGEYEREKEGEK